MQYLTRASVAHFMASCHALHAAGIPILLSHGVSLKSNSAVISFCQFMSIDTPLRASFIRGIHIFSGVDLSNDSTGILRRLGGILFHAVSLKSLTIQDCTCTLELDETFAAAITGLRGIEALRLDTVGQKSIVVLRAIQSPVEFLDMTYEDGGEIIDTINDLMALSPTLTGLSIRWAMFSGMACEYTRLTTLKLKVHYVHLAPLLRISFPNLQDLSLEVESGTWNMEVENLEVTRRVNRQGQETASWPELQHLQGNVEALYGLAIVCKVHKLSVGYLSNADNLAQYRDIVSEARPTEVVMGISSKALGPTWTLPAFASTSVVKLDISLEVVSETNVDDLVVRCIESFNESNLETIDISFCYTDFWHILPWDPSDKPKAEEPVVTSLRNVDWQEFTRRIAEGIPSLQHIHLHVDLGKGNRLEESWAARS